ncbi:hypothetical protein [Hyella patelloides]|uniref:hypothetical protein n=1 Tax=Hyella patelloides TaxID=1982969 RepID=UPI00164398CF|nr:hypothetical protein [Hyella patelloides]
MNQHVDTIQRLKEDFLLHHIATTEEERYRRYYAYSEYVDCSVELIEDRFDAWF